MRAEKEDNAVHVTERAVVVDSVSLTSLCDTT